MSRPFFSFGGFYSRGGPFPFRPPPFFPAAAALARFRPFLRVFAHFRPRPGDFRGFFPAFRGFPAHFAQRAMLICDRFCSFVIDFAQNAQPTRRGPLSWGRPRAGFSLTVFPRASRERGKRFSQCRGKLFRNASRALPRGGSARADSPHRPSPSGPLGHPANKACENPGDSPRGRNGAATPFCSSDASDASRAGPSRFPAKQSA